MNRLLVLRPQPGADATVARARSHGLEAVPIPLFELCPMPWEAHDAGSFDGLLLTSANSVRLAGEELKNLRGLKVWAVGQATADAARSAGFDIAATGNQGVDRLLGSIERDLRLLHLCGADRHVPVDTGQEITPIVVYRAKPVEAPALGDTRDAVALIHSPRAGSRLAELVNERESMSIAAISDAAADASGHGWRRVSVADVPTDDALLALAARLCDKPEPK